MTAVTETQESRHVLVTGGDRGIGRAIAERFLQAGYKVTCADLGGEPPEGAFGVSCNVTDAEQVDAAFKAAEAENGPVGVLVANAGITKDTLILRMGDAEWDAVIDVNLKALFFTCQAFAKETLACGRKARIVNIASLLSFQGGIRVPSYTAAKHGVAGLTKLMANEWAATGINVNAIAPGYIETNNTEALRNDPERNRAILDRIPAGRWGHPEDIAGAAVFLCSPAAAYVHGAVLNVDGGWLAR